MRPTGVSQLIEALCKVFVGVGFALYAKSQGYNDYQVAAFTILGVTVGVLLGMVYLYIRKLFFKEQTYFVEAPILEEETPKRTGEIIKDLAFIAIPITLSSAVLSLTTIIDTFMIQGRLLESGLSEELVRIYYGDYTTLVISMVNLPTILIYPIANALVPMISSAVANKNLRASENMRAFSMRVINLISIPCALGLGLFSKPILDLLMFSQSSVERASSWLSIGAISVIFLGIIAATNAFLNTAGRQRLPIISMVVGAVVKIISNYFLLPVIGIYAAPLSTVLCYLFAASLNIFFTVKFVGKLPNLGKIFGMPIFCALISVGGSALIYMVLSRFIPSKIATIICILVAILSYVFLVLRTKTVTREELELLPNGKKISSLCLKLGFLSKKC